MTAIPMARAQERPERRRKKRIQLTRAIIGRFGATGAIVIDITDSGARIEHFTRLDIAKRARLRFDWNGQAIEVDAQVRSCRVHRFAHGDDGATVYQSGLHFVQYVGAAQNALKEMVATYVARSLAEQVANARGIGPVMERNMPVFRSGVVADVSIAKDDKGRRLIPNSEIVMDRGYIRCTWINGRRWEKKWTRDSKQPEEGFTVVATEPDAHIDQLCETYMYGTVEDRKLIQLMARLSIENPTETPEPVS
jgi:hypothetical protein